MIELITAAAGSFLPTLAIGAGPAGLVAAFLARGGGIYIKLAAAALLAVAIAGATVHYMNLRADSAKLAELGPKIAGLEESLGCPGRPKSERDLFACIPARDRDIAAARAETIRKNEAAAAIARAGLERRNADLAGEMAKANRAIEDASAADDGPLPKIMLDNWRRERVRRGVK